MKANVVILLWEKLDFSSRNIARSRGIFYKDKRDNNQKLYAIKNIVIHCTKQKRTVLKIGMAICIIIVILYNKALSVHDRINR